MARVQKTFISEIVVAQAQDVSGREEFVDIRVEGNGFALNGDLIYQTAILIY